MHIRVCVSLRGCTCTVDMCKPLYPVMYTSFLWLCESIAYRTSSWDRATINICRSMCLQCAHEWEWPGDPGVIARGYVTSDAPHEHKEWADLTASRLRHAVEPDTATALHRPPGHARRSHITKHHVPQQLVIPNPQIEWLWEPRGETREGGRRGMGKLVPLHWSSLTGWSRWHVDGVTVISYNRSVGADCWCLYVRHLSPWQLQLLPNATPPSPPALQTAADTAQLTASRFVHDDNSQPRDGSTRRNRPGSALYWQEVQSLGAQRPSWRIFSLVWLLCRTSLMCPPFEVLLFVRESC